MQVSHGEIYKDVVTIGGGEVVAASMADSPEFYTVLSDTLYTHKLLATIREVLCNANDAHKASGIKAPVEVTVGTDSLTIRDFGKGLSHEDMKRIYLTYGLSTKTSDDNQTGGFGLGSKAPWSYTNHFTVVSRHHGKQTIYAASRCGIETSGRPELRSMAEIPCEDQGLSVEIPIEAGDIRTARMMIQQIAGNGGMNVLIDGFGIETVNEEEVRSAGGFFITKAVGCIPNIDNHHLLVRYGQVLYPVTIAQRDWTPEFTRINQITSSLHQRYRASFVIDMPPGSVGVAPSREALSLKPRTIKLIMDRAAEIHAKVLGNSTRQIASFLKELKIHGSPAIDKWRSRFDGNFVSGRNKICAYISEMNPSHERHLFSQARAYTPKTFDDLSLAGRLLKIERKTRKNAYPSWWRITDKLALELWQDAMRIETRAGLTGKMRICFRNQVKIEKLFRCDFLNDAEGMICNYEYRSPVILIAPNQKEASNWVAAATRVGGAFYGSSHQTVLVFSETMITQEERARLIETAKDLDVKVYEAKKVASEPKETKKQAAKDVFLMSAMLGHRAYSSWGELKATIRRCMNDEREHEYSKKNHPEYFSENPKFYVDLSSMMGSYRYSAWKIYAELYPDAAIVLNQTDKARVEKLGAKDILNKVNKDLEAAVKRRRFWVARRIADFAASGYSYRPAGKVLTDHILMAHFFKPADRPTSKDMNLALLVSHIGNNAYRCGDLPNADVAIVARAAKADYSKVVTDGFKAYEAVFDMLKEKFAAEPILANFSLQKNEESRRAFIALCAMLEKINHKANSLKGDFK